ncbi:aminotransferase class I/II-fold pyridoxal phosphate-dependent enzyme [Agathobacter sp.]
MEKELIENAKSNIYPFHMPGHKRRGAEVLGEMKPYDIDITEIEGFDNLHHANGIIRKAQDEAAQLYGADHAYFLINGSTCGILAALSAATKRGDRILVARNCHKAVYHGIYLRQLRPVFIYPNITKSGIQGQITAAEVKKAFEENPDIKAVVITSPTYDGVVSDVAAIARIAHAHGVPLIVDEAHGAHFGFGGDFPENAIKLGADAVILSLHKTLPAFTQTALLVTRDIFCELENEMCTVTDQENNSLGKCLLDHRQIEKFLGIYETSSPSYVFMTGIERCIHYVRDNGEAPFTELKHHLDNFYQRTSDLRHLRVVRKSDFSAEEAFDFDESKILIFTDKTDMSGQELLEILLHKYDIQLEMAAGSYALALCSIMDTEEGFDRLAEALVSIDEGISLQEGTKYSARHGNMECTVCHKENKLDTSIYQTLPKAMEMYEAYDMETEAVPFSQAAGRTSGAFVYLYPPGIPLVVPGEIINEKLVDDVRKALELGMEVDGLFYDERADKWSFCAIYSVNSNDLPV